MIAYLVALPVHWLTIRSSDGMLLYVFSAPAGFSFTVRFNHSVEGTPVEDEYLLSGGMIRQWEERIKSHNAGLPFKAPSRGRFFQEGEWMKIRGGGNSFCRIRYRVGNSSWGQNVLMVNDRTVELFQLHPDEALLMEAAEGSALLSPFLMEPALICPLPERER
ncbi:MAG: DUF1850 domain-containing protein [Synergistaceae bacterium]|nr:DUF1850 domain-containing protein [Synergistaceae bacterium]